MSSFLFQLVSQPIRKTNILDLVITNLPTILSSVESGPCFVEVGLPSYHYTVIFDIDIKLKLKDSHCKQRYNFDFKSLNEELLLLPLSSEHEILSTGIFYLAQNLEKSDTFWQICLTDTFGWRKIA